jgi:hypothetical protein
VKKNLAFSFAAFHLAVLSLGLFPYFPPPTWPRLQAARDIYQALTGAGGGFGFFSPGIGNQLQITFETKPPLPGPLALDQVVNGEVALRIGNMYRLLAFSYGDEKIKRAVAASLATAVFRFHPEITETTLIATIYRLPSLEEWRRGMRPESLEGYRATFRLSNHP